MEQLLWQQLDTRNKAKWKADFKGHPAAYCCFYSDAADLTVLGDWVLQQHRSGTGAVANWIRQSVTDTVESDLECAVRGASLRYGYQWWVAAETANGFTGIGRGGQYLHAFPEQNVVVQLGEDERADDKTCEMMLVHRIIADQLASQR